MRKGMEAADSHLPRSPQPKEITAPACSSLFLLGLPGGGRGLLFLGRREGALVAEEEQGPADECHILHHHDPLKLLGCHICSLLPVEEVDEIGRRSEESDDAKAADTRQEARGDEEAARTHEANRCHKRIVQTAQELGWKALIDHRPCFGDVLEVLHRPPEEDEGEEDAAQGAAEEADHPWRRHSPCLGRILHRAALAGLWMAAAWPSSIPLSRRL